MTVKLLGLEKVKREMNMIGPRIQKNILRGAVRKIASDIRDDARNTVPIETGILKRNIISKNRRGRRGTIRASVIVRDEGNRGDSRNAFYWRFVEFGHVDRAGNQVPGTAFITRVFERITDRIDQIMVNYMRPRIEKALKTR